MAYSAILQGCRRAAVSMGPPSSLQFRRTLVKATALAPNFRRAKAGGGFRRAVAVAPTCFARPDWRQRGAAAASLQLLNRQSYNHYGSFAYQDVSSDESDHEVRSAQALSQRGQSTFDNVDEWRWKLTMLLRNKNEQEVVSRDRKDRRDFEHLATLAARMGLHSRQYSKVVVFSKLPLPNYRSDLDDKRPQREVLLPVGLQREVDSRVRLHVSERSISGGSLLNTLTFAGLSLGGNVTAEGGLTGQREPIRRNNIDLEKFHRRRSLQLREKQQEWQESPEGQKMLEFRRSLPAYKERDALLKAVSENQVVVVVSGETGCGKTTQLPQYILESEIEAARGGACSIICTRT